MMGAGKTNYIFKEIQRRSMTEIGTRFLYIAPFLAEVGDPNADDSNPEVREQNRRGRIHAACPAADFQTPTSSPTKRKSLKRLLEAGKNIACTHALYLEIDQETATLIEEQEYEVIIDEALEVIQGYQGIKRDDATFLKIATALDPETHAVRWTSSIGDDSKYAGIKRLCEEGRLYHYRGEFWVWELPPELFTRAKKITICTYLFESSVLHSYLTKHGINFVYVDNESIGLRSESELLAEAKKLISIEENPYVQKLAKHSMTVNGYKNLNEVALDKMRNMLITMVPRYLGAKGSELIWTCFKEQKKLLAGKGYARSFLACNTRATNDYRKKRVGIYLVNRHPHVMVNKFLRGSGVAIDPDLYGLSEMIQWIWRLRIRDGKSIRLFIPSERMRRILLRWLDGEFMRKGVDLAA